jgi:hypothetical protein
MPLDLVLDSLDSVKDESIKALYTETDGKFALDTDAYAEFVKKPLVSKNAELKREKDRLKSLERFKDVSDDDFKAFQDWKASQNDDDDEGDGDKGKSGQVDAKKLAKQIKADLLKEFEPKLKAKEDELNAERSKFEQYRFKQDLTTAAIESGVIGTRLNKFMNAAIAEGIFGFHEGKLVVMDDGEPSTEPVSDRLTVMSNADDWKFFFAAKEAGGGSGEHKGRKASSGKKQRDFTRAEKLAFIEKEGYQAWSQLPK